MRLDGVGRVGSGSKSNLRASTDAFARLARLCADILGWLSPQKAEYRLRQLRALSLALLLVFTSLAAATAQESVSGPQGFSEIVREQGLAAGLQALTDTYRSRSNALREERTRLEEAWRDPATILVTTGDAGVQPLSRRDVDTYLPLLPMFAGLSLTARLVAGLDLPVLSALLAASNGSGVTPEELLGLTGEERREALLTGPTTGADPQELLWLRTRTRIETELADLEEIIGMATDIQRHCGWLKASDGGTPSGADPTYADDLCGDPAPGSDAETAPGPDAEATQPPDGASGFDGW